MGILSLKSNLAINGTPERYDTKGVLGNVDDPGGQRVNYSQLDIDNVPERYDTAGKLGSLEENASNLDFDSPLPANADNFTNTNANGFTIQNPVGVSQFINDGQTSIYGRPDIPEKYDTAGKLGSLPEGASQLDFDGPLPGGTDVFENDNAKGFTIKNSIGVSQFVGIQGNTYTNPNGIEIVTTPGIGVDYFNNGYAKGFTIKNPINVSQFAGIQGNTYTNPNGKIINTTPGTGVDFITNIHAKGFTIKNPINVSQFTGISGNTYTNPNGKTINTTPGIGVDFIPNVHAKGFTIKNSWGDSQFNGINGTQFINPSGKNLINSTPEDFGVDYLSNEPQKNFIIRQQKNKSNFTGISDGGYGTNYSFVTPLNRLRVTNWFPNETSGATGFKDRIAPYESGFIGISADNTKYQYPDTVKGARLLNVAMGSALGTAKLENQLGIGSKMGNTGFYAENRYSEAVRNDSNQSLLMSWALRRRSPSPLEQQYSKFKLQDEAFNPTFMPQPYVLRGLQNPDFLGPQRWGLTAGPNGQALAGGMAAALDGGFIRGGASTAVERAAIDTARIAKFMASPKGIVWVITQIGLGKSNVRPYGYLSTGAVAELTKNPAIAINNTHTHLGITSLLSVPGTPFGLHFTRHGIPFLNEAADYSNFHRGLKQDELDMGKSLNRLALLKKDLLVAPIIENDKKEITRLSKVGGPQSVYGLGFTTIRRAVDTSLKNQLGNANDDVRQELFGRRVIVVGGSLITGSDIDYTPDLTVGRYSFKSRYAPFLNQNRTTQGTFGDDTESSKDQSYTAEPFNNYSIGLAHIWRRTSNDSTWNPGEGRYYQGVYVNNSTAPKTSLNDIKSEGSNDNSGNKWATLDYTKLNLLAFLRTPGTTIATDFRKELLANGDEKKASSNLIPLVDKLANTVKEFTDQNKQWNPGNRGETADGSGANKNTNDYSSANTGTSLRNDDKIKINQVRSYDDNPESGNKWNVLPYQEIRNIAKERSSRSTTINDFRSKINNKGSTGDKLTTHFTDPEIANYNENNLRDRYGFGNQGLVGADRSNPFERKNKNGVLVGNVDDARKRLKDDGKYGLTSDSTFRGDKVNAIDFIKTTNADDIYPEGAEDFIKFYFSGIKLFDATESEAIVFRATIKGLADSFSPGWNSIQVMGRPDGPAIYSSFERNLSFNFTVAATSREELVPMWRKLNYLGSYTMPIYGQGKPGGALCRMTIGDMFSNVPGYFTGLTISVNDEASWDLASDWKTDNATGISTRFNKSAKQLPNLVDVDVQFKVLHDWRPQKGGRVYYLYDGNYTSLDNLKNSQTSWLWDSSI